MATSAEKRKWRRLSKQESNPKILEQEDSMLQNTGNDKKMVTNKMTKNASSSTSEPSNAHPFFFLVVFPVLLTSLVILTREDLREELDQKGLVKLIKDWRREAPQTHGQSPQSIGVRQKENPQ
ncbi:hypothetical protein IV203_007097 [Nitzschia inconspicua]|uniref:Uncharacterized protein n=1 Tax=Nitzschia inconspicua TaxID=303405 RepID=A0A9K3KE63_9STRA|nr:hypothetical protein IV203_007097 [Nitzschia inconspicua]